jgi:predicted DNA binding CopG/RHH family protein
MKKEIRYTDEPMNFKVIDDFLPPPERLALREENVRVTITLSRASIEFFKKYAKKTHGHYQAMIRRILDHYVAHYQ